MTSQATNRREGGLASCPGCSQQLRTYTQKELVTAWAAPELLGVLTIGGGSARSRGGGGGGHRSQISLPSRPKQTKTEKKKPGGFAHVLASKSPKTPFFAQKYLTRYTHETFFEKYMNFETHYLIHCRVIPLQNFGSHIRSQPHGLGLKAEAGCDIPFKCGQFLFHIIQNMEMRFPCIIYSTESQLCLTFTGQSRYLS